ncbi:hypothetical protein SAMN04489724_1345 [Algoriphagus locisalis]|uniref:Uncharacterized protein n=1 Tax=Algoriphagus locisalis TaxID=305507 RepID=A0A1I6Z0R6_9BACT|nr:hypothetical protein SAMN04489724_1345 [Algoriphagus locisalis]
MNCRTKFRLKLVLLSAKLMKSKLDFFIVREDTNDGCAEYPNRYWFCSEEINLKVEKL